MFDTPFTIKQLEDEINNAKLGGQGQQDAERERNMLKQFLKDHKLNQMKYEET